MTNTEISDFITNMVARKEYRILDLIIHSMNIEKAKDTTIVAYLNGLKEHQEYLHKYLEFERIATNQLRLRGFFK
jgi:uncharacterized protein YeeX (DUF496 family)